MGEFARAPFSGASDSSDPSASKLPVATPEEDSEAEVAVPEDEPDVELADAVPVAEAEPEVVEDALMLVSLRTSNSSMIGMAWTTYSSSSSSSSSSPSAQPEGVVAGGLGSEYSISSGCLSGQPIPSSQFCSAANWAWIRSCSVCGPRVSNPRHTSPPVNNVVQGEQMGAHLADIVETLDQVVQTFLARTQRLGRYQLGTQVTATGSMSH